MIIAGGADVVVNVLQDGRTEIVTNVRMIVRIQHVVSTVAF